MKWPRLFFLLACLSCIGATCERTGGQEGLIRSLPNSNARARPNYEQERRSSEKWQPPGAPAYSPQK